MDWAEQRKQARDKLTEKLKVRAAEAKATLQKKLEEGGVKVNWEKRSFNGVTMSMHFDYDQLPSYPRETDRGRLRLKIGSFPTKQFPERNDGSFNWELIVDYIKRLAKTIKEKDRQRKDRQNSEAYFTDMRHALLREFYGMEIPEDANKYDYYSTPGPLRTEVGHAGIEFKVVVTDEAKARGLMGCCKKLGLTREEDEEDEEPKTSLSPPLPNPNDLRLSEQEEYAAFAALCTMVEDVHAVQDTMTEEQWQTAEALFRRLERRANAKKEGKS